MNQIIINPNVNIQYSAFYIHGLEKTFGKNKVCFAKKNQLGIFNKSGEYCFTFLVNKSSNGFGYIKVAIDYSDFNIIKEKETYEWSDIYGKINTNWTLTPAEKYPKIVSLASNFGIRCFGIFEGIFLALSNYFKVNPSKKKKFFAQYWKQNKRLWLNQFPLSETQNNYIFSVHTLWYSDEFNLLDESTNKIRAEFMETCLSLPQIRFEGGFIPSLLGNVNYQHLQIKNPLTHYQYIKKLNKSVIAFNTPAVWGCHGWKLSEFLCMGKAIISTQLMNNLPAPLIHGESIHFVKDKNELYDAIILLNNNIGYRKKLEKGARDYYNEFVSPESVIKLLGI